MMENKMHTLKRVFACVLVVLMTVTAVPMSGFVGLELPKWSEMFTPRVSAATSGYYTYTVSNEKSTITGCYYSISGEVVLPDTLGGYPVTSIGNFAFDGCTGLTNITIPDSVTNIGGYAFYDCPSLTSATIGNSVTSVGDYAFYNCTGLTSVTIGNNVTRIGESVFQQCTNLVSVMFGNNLASIGRSAFKGCTSLTSITIPDSVTSIGYSAFGGCTGLTSVTIPEGETSIGSSAFKGCTSLTKITIHDSVISIGRDVFDDTAWYNAQPFGDVYLGNFYYKYKGTMLENTSIVIKNGTKGIAGAAFIGCHRLTSITIPDSVTSIGYSAFSSCTGLSSVTIPDSVTSIGYSAFSYCYRMTRITIPDSVNSIGDYAFENCKGLTSITIPDSVKSIGDNAFENCKGITSITIPNSVTSIGNEAFRTCYNLTRVTIGDGVETISSGAFEDCPLTTIKIGKNVKTIEKDAFKEIKEIPEVYYAGSEADWKKISIDQSNDMILRAKMHYNVNLSHTHSYTAKITKKATCTENGVKTYTCNCGKTVTKSIPATGHKYKTENQAATCTSIGVSIKKCTVCGKVEYANTTPAKGHTLKTDVEPATFTESGLSTTSCKTCGTITKATLIKRIASVTLSATKYAYNGKTQTPTVVVKDSAGKVLKNKTDYTVSYASGRKNPGKYAVKVTFKGNYTGTKTLYFTISPTAPSLTVTAGAKKATLKWNKQVGATGYVVYMATSKNGKYSRIAVLKGNSAVSYTKTGLTTGRTYYFKIASYTTSGTSNIYSAWSSVKGVKIK